MKNPHNEYLSEFQMFNNHFVVSLFLSAFKSEYNRKFPDINTGTLTLTLFSHFIGEHFGVYEFVIHYSRMN